MTLAKHWCTHITYRWFEPLKMPSHMVGTTTHTQVIWTLEDAKWYGRHYNTHTQVNWTLEDAKSYGRHYNTHTHRWLFFQSSNHANHDVCWPKYKHGNWFERKLGNLAPPSRKFTFKTCNIHFFLCWNIAQKHVKMTVSKPVGSPRVTVFTITQPRWAKAACERALYVSWVFGEELKPVLPFFCTANFFSPW